MKHFKSSKLFLPLIGLTLLLSGCGQINNNAPGFYKYLAIPTTVILNGLAKIGGYGISVIILTIIVRLALIPVSLHQTKNTTIHQEQLRPIQKQIDRLRDRRINSPLAERRKAAKDIRGIYHRYHISSTGGIGCLPLIFQIIVFMSLYSSIKFSNAVFHSQLFGMPLGDKNHVIPVIVLMLYLLQIFISSFRMGKKKKGLWAMFVSPMIIFLVTFSAPVGISIYFIICATFACIQAYLTNIYGWRILHQIQNHELKINTATDAEVQKIKEQVDARENDTNTNEQDKGTTKERSSTEQASKDNK